MSYRLLILLSTLFIIPLIQAGELPYRPQSAEFLQKWVRSERKAVTDNNETAQVQTMIRHLTIGHIQYPIGSITYLELPKRMEVDTAEIKKSLQTGYDIRHWSTQRQGSTYIWEGRWEKGNRIVRLAIDDSGESVRAVTSLYRIGYQEPLAVESYIIEQRLLGKTDSHRKTSSFLPNFLGIPKAYAQSPPTGFSGLGPILESISPTDIASSNPGMGPVNVQGDIDVNVSGHVTGGVDANTGSLINNINTNVNQNWGDSNQNWNNTNQVIDQNWQDSNQNWQDTNQIIDQNWQDSNQNWQDSNQNWQESNEIIDQNWQETNKQMAQANETAAKLADPKHMFLLSGASAAGAVVGGFAANMAIQGLISGVDWMIEQMTGRRAAQERWQQFQESRRNWEETQEHALELEKSIDQMLLFHETLETIKARLPESERENLSTEDIIRFFNIEILMKEREIAQLEQQFMNETNEDCLRQLADPIASKRDLVNNMSQVVSTLSNHQSTNPQFDIFDERYFCSQMDYMMRNLLDAESTLQRYRLHLINGQAEWQQDLAEEVEELQEVSERLQADGDDTLDRSIRATQELYETNYNSLRNRLKRECREEGLLFTRGCVNEKLGDQAAHEHNRMIQARDQAFEEARVSAERRLNRPVTVNTDIEYDRVRAYQDWFEELEDQQYCNQNPDHSSCRELSQFRHNGVFYVKNRALQRMDDVCPGRRMTLSAIEQQNAQALAQAGESEDAGRAPASSSGSGGGGGFFSQLLSGIGDFFRSIGQFFGLIPKDSAPRYGEYTPTEARETVTAHDLHHVDDSPRVSPDANNQEPQNNFTRGENTRSVDSTSERGDIGIAQESTSELPTSIERTLSQSPLASHQDVLRQDLTDTISSYPESTEDIQETLETIVNEPASSSAQNFREIYSNDTPEGLRQYLLPQISRLSTSDFSAWAQSLRQPIVTFSGETGLETDELERHPAFYLIAGIFHIDMELIPEDKKTSRFYLLLTVLKSERTPLDQKQEAYRHLLDIMRE